MALSGVKNYYGVGGIAGVAGVSHTGGLAGSAGAPCTPGCWIAGAACVAGDARPTGSAGLARVAAHGGGAASAGTANARVKQTTSTNAMIIRLITVASFLLGLPYRPPAPEVRIPVTLTL